MGEEEGDEGDLRSRTRASGPPKWLTSFQKDLTAGAVMGGWCTRSWPQLREPSFCCRPRRATLLSSPAATGGSRACVIVSFVRSGKRAFSLCGGAMGVAFYVITPPLLSISPLRCV
ncbi:hypothetical protein CK203_003536 [Vitis vinifera]|uniref:Uncharacterized protein n=1 Tax=Vitis vinifera TaxID=29760 RepID=A0A438K817_VITVI|nr:hypothetical protein CK203_003536 [Vitis vinifera]